MPLASSWHLEHPRAHALADATMADPFAVLGPHRTPDGWIVRAFVPGANRVEVLRVSDGSSLGVLERSETDGLFEGPIEDFESYCSRLMVERRTGNRGPMRSACLAIWTCICSTKAAFRPAEAFGAQISGSTAFPAFASSYGRPMQGGSRLSAISMAGTPTSCHANALNLRGAWLHLLGDALGSLAALVAAVAIRLGVSPKADPVARQAELAPATASIVAASDRFQWQDDAWVASRAARHDARAPIAIYEMHLGSWLQRREGAHEEGWDEAIARLIPMSWKWIHPC
jgi:1,4-alpha-glucan branching enzyme